MGSELSNAAARKIWGTAFPLNVAMTKNEDNVTGEKRDLRYQDKHDVIYKSLDRILNWMVKADLSFTDDCQWDEKERVKKFHLLMRDLARRFTGKRDLDKLAWFLNQEGRRGGKRFHFHLAITNDNLEHTTPETVCRYLNKQWRKIGKSVCKIVPWNKTKGARGIWYVTQKEDSPLDDSRYFHGEFCHWKMSTLLHQRISAAVSRKENYER